MNQEIVEYNNLNMLEEKGKHIYSTNQHYRNLCTIMEHPEFRNFYNLYLKNIEDSKTILMFMKMYDKIDNHFKSLNSFQKISILKDMIDNSESRKIICDSMTTCDFLSEKRHHNYIQ
jgi:hypothetical protein